MGCDSFFVCPTVPKLGAEPHQQAVDPAVLDPLLHRQQVVDDRVRALDEELQLGLGVLPGASIKTSRMASSVSRRRSGRAGRAGGVRRGAGGALPGPETAVLGCYATCAPTQMLRALKRPGRARTDTQVICIMSGTRPLERERC